MPPSCPKKGGKGGCGQCVANRPFAPRYSELRKASRSPVRLVAPSSENSVKPVFRSRDQDGWNRGDWQMGDGCGRKEAPRRHAKHFQNGLFELYVGDLFMVVTHIQVDCW